jgi:hypothetical protein
VEFFLNIAWFAVSVFLTAWCISRFRRRGAAIKWTAFVALALLVVLLLPAISITDDLMAIQALAEVEHTLPRDQAGLPAANSASLMDAIPFDIRTVSVSPLLGIESAQLRPRTVSTAILTGFVRALGVRPPTKAAEISLGNIA